jgi:hypothetical protein
MKRDRIIYWTTTGLLALAMVMSAFMYLTKAPDLVANFQQLGYPLYFVAILGVAKLVGAIALLVPVAERVKEWTYAGFAFTFIGAVWTHLATNTPWIAPAVFFVLLVGSYVFWLRTHQRLNHAVSERSTHAVHA